MAKKRYTVTDKSVTDETTGFRLRVGEVVNVKDGQHVAGPNSWEVQRMLAGASYNGQVDLVKTLGGIEYSWRVRMNHCVPAARAAGMRQHPSTWRTPEQLHADAKALAKATGARTARVMLEVISQDGTRTKLGGEWVAPVPLVYAAGTRLGDVPEFDRSQHVTFRCSDHPEVQWLSKEPARSAWFPATDKAARCPQSCTVAADNYELVLDYTITPQRK